MKTGSPGNVHWHFAEQLAFLDRTEWEGGSVSNIDEEGHFRSELTEPIDVGTSSRPKVFGSSAGSSAGSQSPVMSYVRKRKRREDDALTAVRAASEAIRAKLGDGRSLETGTAGQDKFYNFGVWIGSFIRDLDEREAFKKMEQICSVLFEKEVGDTRAPMVAYEEDYRE
ncbi:hypothetical protein GCK32_007073, partial [Trichostrongylus colubriformis]